MKRFALLLLSLCLVLVGCAAESEAPASSEQSAEPAYEAFTVAYGGAPVYKIVRAKGLGSKSVDAILAVNNRIKELGGTYLNVEVAPQTEYDAPDGDVYEILVGVTNRPESVSAAAALEPYTFSISFVGNAVVIVGTDDGLLAEGLEYFAANYLSDVESGEGFLKLKATENYASVSKASGFAELLKTATELETECSAVYTVPKPTAGDAKVVQGGCLVGKYYYQAFILKDTASNEQNNTVRIVKYDTELKKTVLESEALPLNHANDITYNAKLDRLIVVHNNPNRTHISFVDPETLTITETKEIDFKIYCIDYNENSDSYVIGLSGGQSFRILDAEFNAVGDVFEPTELTSGYVTQGCACDDNYVYFVLYKKNVITVYDWQGAFVTLLKLDVGAIEPENLTVAGDKIYVGCAGSGCKVFEVVPAA